jgi:hypothetical protein
MPQEYSFDGWPVSDAPTPGGKRFVTAKNSMIMHYQRGESQHDAVWVTEHLVRPGEEATNVSTVCNRLFRQFVIVSDELIWLREVCPRCLRAIEFESESHREET